jgi:hypothetical protein
MAEFLHEVQELLNGISEQIQQSRTIGFTILSRMFDYQQGGIVSQITHNIDGAMEATPLTEGTTKRRVVQRLARLNELQNVIAASRNFCRYVVTPGTAFAEALHVEGIPVIAAHIPANNGNIELYVNESVEAVERHLTQALRITLQSFRATLVAAEAGLTQIQAGVDAANLVENAHKRQVRTSLEFCEATVRELKRIVAYFEGLDSVVPFGEVLSGEIAA